MIELINEKKFACILKLGIQVEFKLSDLDLMEYAVYIYCRLYYIQCTCIKGSENMHYFLSFLLWFNMNMELSAKSYNSFDGRTWQISVFLFLSFLCFLVLGGQGSAGQKVISQFESRCDCLSFQATHHAVPMRRISLSLK